MPLEEEMTLVREIMGQPIVRCREGDSLEQAAGLMWDHDCGIVPVVNDAEQVTGVITDRDICMAAYTRGRRLRDLRVDDAMAKKVFTCGLDDDIRMVEHMMAELQIRRVPVVDGEKRPVGMLSLGDIARYATTDGAPRADEHAFAKTLSAICRPTRRALTTR